MTSHILFHLYSCTRKTGSMPSCGNVLRNARLLAKPSSKPLSLWNTAYFSGASGNLSTTYFPLATLMIGTPGTFLTLLFRSLSFVATR